ncbi:DUF3556 domain-containing protein, partial [Mycobacterium avium]|uniref:DUF3556 domain-containing protein n=1 Tax=Mycobacterium avium TaxID=1764 RepID=UPI000AB78297
GEVRVVILDAQPIHRQTQEYRLVDAATGEFERGYCNVDDMATAQPWADDLKARVIGFVQKPVVLASLAGVGALVVVVAVRRVRNR